MKPFEYVKVTSVAQAMSLLSKHQEKAAILAGGSDLLGIMKDRIEGPKLKMPQSLIDIKGIKDLNYMKEQKGGLKIGATATLADIASSSLVAERLPLLVQALNQVGVPQIRNVGTWRGISARDPAAGTFAVQRFQRLSSQGRGQLLCC